MSPEFAIARRASLACVAALATLLPSLLGAQAPGTLRDNPAQHVEWFEHERRFPFVEIPRGRYQEALRQFRARASARGGSALFALTGASNGWTALGPGSIPGLFLASTGRVAALAMQPGNNNVVYAAGAQGGIWRTTNGGANWLPLSDNECSLAMGALAIDPINPSIIYAGTGEMTNSSSSYYGCGVLRSADGGATWTQLGAGTFDFAAGGATFSSIVIDSATAGGTTSTVLYAGTSVGLFKSVDAGASWTLQMSGRISDVVIDRGNPQHLVAAIGSAANVPSNGVFITVNGGANWTQVTNGFPTTNVGRIRLAIARTNGARVYAAVQNSSGTPGVYGTLLGIYRSNDGGASWVQVNPNNSGVTCASQCWYDMYVMVDPLDENRVYFGGLTLSRSTNGGDVFAQISGPMHVDHHAMAIDPLDPAIIYAGNDGGVYKSLDTGRTWATLNNDLSLTQFYPGISVHPTDPARVFGGTQDNGTVQYTGNAAWSPVLGGDGSYTAINHVDASSWWAQTQWTPSSGFSGPQRRDAQLGGGFVHKINGIDVSDRGQFIAPLVMDPVNPHVLYFGTFRLYRTRNNGENWTAVSGDLSGGSATISAIGIPRSDTAMIYVGTSDGRVQISQNYGASFTLASGLPVRVVKDFAFDPSDPQIAWVTFSGFGTGHVWKTTNRGATWTDVSGNLPNIPVNAIAHVFPQSELVVGTDVGLYRTSDGGSNWVPWPGIPNAAVFDLVYNPNTGQLVAATHGRGMFAYQSTAVVALRGDVTGDSRVGALDAQAILYHVVGLTLPGTFRPAPQGDANCDASTTAVDAQIILAYVVGLAVPSGACVGQYR